MGLIRLLLALSVVIAHGGQIFGLKLVGGQIAVQAFYIISGFYMSLILNEKYIGKNNSYRLFLTNRFIRLYPIYLVVLLTTILAAFILFWFNNGNSLPAFESFRTLKTNWFSISYLIFSNIFIFGQDLVMLLGINPENGNLFFTENFRNTIPQLHSFMFVPQAWTLGLELTFYLIAPFILKKRPKTVLLLTLSSLFLRLYIFNFLELKNDPWTYRFFPTEIMFFLMGYFSYQLYLKIKTISIPPYFNLFILILAIASTIWYAFLPSLKINYFPFSGKEIFYFCVITLSIPILFNYLKAQKWDNQIGELSYPVYISHVLIVLICRIQPLDFFKTGWMIALITLLVAYTLNTLVAVRFEKFRQARLSK